MSESKPTAAKRIAAFQQRIAKELATVGKELSKQLATAAETYKVLTSVKGGNVWEDAQYAKVLDTLGLGSVARHQERQKGKASPADLKMGRLSSPQSKRKAKGKGRGRGKRVSDDAFLSVITKPTPIGVVAKSLGVTKLTASNRLKALAKANKATSRKVGTKVLYAAK